MILVMIDTKDDVRHQNFNGARKSSWHLDAAIVCGPSRVPFSCCRILDVGGHLAAAERPVFHYGVR